VSAGSAEGPASRPQPKRGPRLTPVRLVLAVGLLAITIAAAAILLQREPRRAGTNLTADAGFVIPLGAGQQLCEPGELLPGDTGALKLDASTDGLPGPRLSATLSGPRGPVSSGYLKAGWHPGAVSIPVSRVRDTVSGATVCLRNLGDRRVTFAGSAPDSGFFIQLAGKPLSGRLRIEYMRPGRESWLQLLPTLAHRFSLAKSDLVRHWVAGATLLLMLLALVVATRTLLQEEPDTSEEPRR
jgi:hypothetical protein